MPVKIGLQTRDYIENVPLPTNNGNKYTVISHKSLLNEVYENLDKEGFKVENESFRVSQEGQIMNAHLQLSLNLDPELKFEFGILNSYNKQKKVTVCSGSRVVICENGCILGTSEYGSYKRKHSGKADVETKVYIQEMVKSANDSFEEILLFKQKAKEIMVTKKIIANLIGDMYLNEKFISDSQMSIIRKEMENPSFNYNSNENSLWHHYNNITFALKESNAKDYIKNHQNLSNYCVNNFGIITNKKQLTLA